MTARKCLQEDGGAADVAIIGAGPAGMSAALAAAAKGLSVVVFDEQAQPGGQIFRQPPESYAGPALSAYKAYPFGKELVSRAKAARHIDWRFRRTVWGIFPNEGGGAKVCANGEIVDARTVIISTGAYELPVAFPGWTLPGVMGAGAIQTLAKSQYVLPGRRFVLAGSHPLLILVADLLLSAGAEILEIAIARPRPGFLELVRALPALPGNGHVFLQAAKALGNIMRHRVPLRFGRRIVEARGEKNVTHVVLGDCDANWSLTGKTTTYEADVLGIGYGLLASSELARQAGCRTRWSEAQGGWIIEQDEDMCASIPGLYVAGEPSGIGGAALSAAEGHLAGLAAAARIAPAAVSGEELAIARRRVVKAKRFSEVFARFFAPKLHGLAQAATDDTLVCRCEDVSARAVRGLLAENPHVQSVNSVKLACRTGMGFCQGRYCQHTVAQIVAAERGLAVEDCGQFTARVPAKPVTVADLAGLGSAGSVKNPAPRSNAQ